MKRVLTALVLIPIVLLVVFKAPSWVYGLVVGTFAVGSGYEYLTIAKAYNKAVSLISGTFIIAVFFAAYAISEYIPGIDAPIVPIIVLFLVLTGHALFSLAIGLRRDDNRESMTAAALGFFVIPYVLVPFASMLLIRELRGGEFLMLLLFVMVWSGDIFAYYVGKNFGKHLLAPSISPKKTWEGSIASVVGCVLVSIALCWFAPALQEILLSARMLSRVEYHATLTVAPTWVAIVLALIVNIVAQAGDLVESMIKRGANVKDSGSILPGHGGLLDRVDALLFAAPVAMLLFLVTGKYFIL